jgi:TetR/AcrR family transcriptional regulator, repressor for uid operon
MAGVPLKQQAVDEATSDSSSLLARAMLHTAGAVDEEISARVLDAARDVFCRAGIQRSTMEDVARAAGVARITVYRRFATKDVLVEQVVIREFRRYFDQFLVDVKQARTAADRVVIGFVSSLRAIRGNPLIGGLMATEPGVLEPSIVGDNGRALAVVREFLTGQLRREQEAGHVSADLNVELAAEMMVRISTSFLVTPSQILDLDDDEQMGAIARQFLVPMLEPVRA